ncbi:monovalent cation:proton antiporter-2 (CPA2) family protein [Haloferula chungangensis]|uniref:Monovalent cation:proton antiporter-2 (CPA2) family protein n=1 Tax=Haloferula chungangensis TaxID=1048331 RepID=A0ABW2L4Z9_9BACT
MDPDLFLNAFIYLLAAAVAAPLGKRLGLGAVLGYLLIGSLIGPSAFGIIGSDQEEVMHFAEFGVVLMLFVIGLELDLTKLWRMRAAIFGLGGLQLVLSAAALALVGGLIAEDWREAITLGLILALSSTAIVMQTLKERGLAETNAGKQSFAVLLFQDIAVIPILAVIPLLAYRSPISKGEDEHATTLTTWMDQLPAWAHGFIILGAIGLIIVLGRFLLTPWLNWVARLKVPEALNATTLTLVVGVALLMNSVGLSAALGTFVAGVMLASSSYRHELEGNIEPFKSLLLAVFFLAVGASIDFALIAEKPALIALFVTLLILIKFLVLLVLGKVFRLGFDQRLLFGVALAQGGEFAFVLGGFALAKGAMSPELSSLMIASVALSMALSPLLLIFLQRAILPRFGTTRSEKPERESDIQNDHPEIILAGFGRFGHPIVRLLRSVGHCPTVLEKDSDHIDFLRRIGATCYYGDATRLQLLHSAGAADAKLMIIAIDDEDGCLTIINHCRKHFPHLRILARACSRNHAYLLHEAEVEYFIEQLGSSLDCGIAALDAIGHHLDHSKDAARRFKDMEFKAIANLAGQERDEKSYISAAQQNIRDLESLLSDAPIRTAAQQAKSAE